jgi:hypothetical protein
MLEYFTDDTSKAALKPSSIKVIDLNTLYPTISLSLIRLDIFLKLKANH